MLIQDVNIMPDETAKKPEDSAVRTTVTLPRDVYRRVRMLAGYRDTSAAQIMTDAITEWTRAEMKELGLSC